MGLSQKTYHFSLRLNTRLSWFNYSQTLNSVTTTNERTKCWAVVLAYRNMGISVLVTIKDTVSFQNHKIKFETTLTVDDRRNFFKLWTFKFEYENLKNQQ
jgi:hypothetical protein